MFYFFIELNHFFYLTQPHRIGKTIRIFTYKRKVYARAPVSRKIIKVIVLCPAVGSIDLQPRLLRLATSDITG
jgi:hypothetical protein